MAYITLYRKDFKKLGEGIDFFDDVLSQVGMGLTSLGLNTDKWDEIESIEIGVDGVLNVFDEDDNTLA